MPALRLILGDQLSHSLSSLQDIDPATDIILMCEVLAEATYVRHHQKKIAFLFAAMRHFAAELRERNYRVRYIPLDDPANVGSFEGEVGRALADYPVKQIIVTEPGEYRLLTIFQSWAERFGLPVHIRQDTRFLATIAEFRRWHEGKSQPRMEFFYREMRRKHRLLLAADGSPAGGQWNYDKDNRKPPKAGMAVPKRLAHPKSPIIKDVLAMVASRFGDHFGALEPFHFAVTREQALAEARHFMKGLLPGFGDYQDAMVAGDPYLYHSLLSCYLNAGLLLPRELCQMAEAEFRAGRAPLNCVEGFIRQILGWREYVRGIYWLHMPGYADRNYLAAHRPLPALYWTANTAMFCLAEAVRHTRDHAYSHHIQRLMLTGNFALLAGLAPAEVCEWYLIVYADAYEWVELPNTLGMALYGDAGIMGSKPYAASGKYIHRMSNYCERCQYDPDETVGEAACPFNALYWDFMARNAAKLRGGQRLTYVYAGWDKMSPEKQQSIRAQASLTLAKLDAGEL
jgi:deoxyribodipyrimidine photolyase-related protein